MYTSYEIWRKGYKKLCGHGFAEEWKGYLDETKERIRYGNAFEKVFDNLIAVSRMEGKSRKGEKVEYMRLHFVGHSESDKELKKKLLNKVFYSPYWVISSYDFDEFFEIVGFNTKEEAYKYYKFEFKNAEEYMLFMCEMFKM